MSGIYHFERFRQVYMYFVSYICLEESEFDFIICIALVSELHIHSKTLPGAVSLGRPRVLNMSGTDLTVFWRARCSRIPNKVLFSKFYVFKLIYIFGLLSKHTY